VVDTLLANFRIGTLMESDCMPVPPVPAAPADYPRAMHMTRSVPPLAGTWESLKVFLAKMSALVDVYYKHVAAGTKPLPDDGIC
jgi:hypothetical protein